MTEALDAYRKVNFDWTQQLKSVWIDAGNDFALHELTLKEIVEEILDYDQSPKGGPASPAQVGKLFVGPAGIGKTHLVGQLRQEIWKRGGWFVLLDIIGIKEFWSTTALSYLQSLLQPFKDNLSQGDAILKKLVDLGELGPAITTARLFDPAGRDAVLLAQSVVIALAKKYPAACKKHGTVIGAFVLLQSRDFEISNQAYSWLLGIGADESPFKDPVAPERIVEGLSWLISLTGPMIVAVDQLDPIVSFHSLSTEDPDAGSEEQRQAQVILEGLCNGLSELFDKSARTTTVLSCIEATWEILKKRSLASFKGRFDDPIPLQPITVGEAVRGLVRSRTDECYTRLKFKPHYPTWPVAESAFETAIGLVPREILRRCDVHRKACIRNNAVTELVSFSEDSADRTETVTSTNLDARFDLLRAEVNVEGLLTQERETELSDLLLDALRLYCKQVTIPAHMDLIVEADPHKRKPALHARLRRVHLNEHAREEHFCFRAIPHQNATAFQSRLRAAVTATGIDLSLSFRHLFIVRRGPVPSGAKTTQMVAEFKATGGQLVDLSDDDLRSLIALRRLSSEGDDEFESWMRAKAPLCRIPLFGNSSLCEQGFSPKPEQQAQSPRAVKPLDSATSNPGVAEKPLAAPNRDLQSRSESVEAKICIRLGQFFGSKINTSCDLPLGILPRHVAVLAGSGSGKTVLLRRIIEEVALLGVPAIVLDTNNDLARMGEPWPQAPKSWDEAELKKSRDYFKRIERVVWTPGFGGGNPIVLAPMPTFSTVRGNEDELKQTVDMAYAALKPFVGVQGSKGVLKEGVLRQALEFFSMSGKEGLDAFTKVLADLPAEVSDIDNATKIAAEMANLIKAEVAKNPLLGSKGIPLDPKSLFFSKSQSKTRISIINFSGLPDDNAKQAFVNQLEMALFTWIKKNPSSSSSLTGLFVIDEAQNFAPSLKNTPCKESTIALVSQARKYGLGMIFATQVPKSIDNKIISNCTTHFYGKMNSPATISATRELMAANGGDGSDIAGLSAGEFYIATDRIKPPQKIRSSLCFSYHPQSPLTQEEVMARAKADRALV